MMHLTFFFSLFLSSLESPPKSTSAGVVDHARGRGKVRASVMEAPERRSDSVSHELPMEAPPYSHKACSMPAGLPSLSSKGREIYKIDAPWRADGPGAPREGTVTHSTRGGEEVNPTEPP